MPFYGILRTLLTFIYKENTMEAQSPMSTLFIFVIFGLIFYFMIYRPQAKRNKEHKN